MNIHNIEVYKRFERLWHWSQMALITTLLVTGFAVHGVHSLIEFELAVTIHTIAALAMIGIWTFAIFWLITTGEWRHYMPTVKNLSVVVRYYIHGIFKGEHHPYIKTYRRKHNPLQALTYLLIKVIIFPTVWITGIAYLLISFGIGGDFFAGVGLGFIADLHTVAAFAILAFVCVHVYLLTTGDHGFIAHVKPMVTGFDEVELTDEEYAYLKADEPGRLRDIK
jgi:thiosulfate reductase cytochrome b subunit